MSLPKLNCSEEDWEALLYLLPKSGGIEVNCCKSSNRVTLAVAVVKVTSVSRSKDILKNGYVEVLNRRIKDK